jgi:hypothetical protein
MKIEIEISESPKEMRYKTSGDFWEDKGIIIFQILKQKDSFTTLSILIHELIEYLLTKERNISEPEIMKFDMKWNNLLYEEPGDDPKAPYFREHTLAKIVERMICNELGKDFKEYSDGIID